MATTDIRSPNGTLLCRLDENASEIKIITPTGATKGRYEKNSNKTYRIDGHFVGYGNLLMTLL